jgi:hypothetical protein
VSPGDGVIAVPRGNKVPWRQRDRLGVGGERVYYVSGYLRTQGTGLLPVVTTIFVRRGECVMNRKAFSPQGSTSVTRMIKVPSENSNITPQSREFTNSVGKLNLCGSCVGKICYKVKGRLFILAT